MHMYITLDHPGTKNPWESPSSTMSMLTVAILLKRQASRFLFLRVALWNTIHLEKRIQEILCLKYWNTMPANLITNSRILLNGEVLEMFKAALEAQIGSNDITITHFNNTMCEFMTSMCPTDIREDITNWLLNI